MYHSGNELLDPTQVFEKAQVRPGMHVADFGCGRTGHIVFPLAQIIGEQGVVYAVDILKDVLGEVEKRIQQNGLLNVHTVWSNVEYVGKTAIPEKSLDMVLLVTLLCHSENRHGILEEAKRLLKSIGRIVIVDWTADSCVLAPKKEQCVDFDDVISWGRMHGMALQEECLVGKHHNMVVLFKQE